jgi:opacity protein-like surface antigen
MKTASSIVLLGLLGAVPAISTAGVLDNPTGPYIGAGVGRFNLDVRNLDDVGNAVDSLGSSHDRAWKAFVGYRFLPFLGVEAAYLDFGRPSDRFTGTGSNGSYDLRLSGWSPSLVGRVPLGPVEILAKVGYYIYDADTHVEFDGGLPDIDSSHSRSDFIWGTGLSVVVLEHLELRGEYERVQIKNAKDSDVVWASAAWRF